METWGPRGVFALTAAFPLVVSLAAVLIDEQPVGPPRLKPDQTHLGARPLEAFSAHTSAWTLVQILNEILGSPARMHCMP